MSNEIMTVGSIRTTAIPPQGIYEALLEKAERELENMQDQRDLAMRMAKEREKERDHYKQALEEISSSIDDWLNSIIQEPSLDFIHAIKAWADKKLKEI